MCISIRGGSLSGECLLGLELLELFFRLGREDRKDLFDQFLLCVDLFCMRTWPTNRRPR
jgi:hypothetical protein